ncbi:MAG: beta-propeller fold lactonase family protein [Myxococcales bacterium]|nr:beta-propeller fold lactonase family protein [Myxococcales bacterium]MDD9965162.1 beta-propeller fold lactonase family protein [Myxococcales bacterium]
MNHYLWGALLALLGAAACGKSLPATGETPGVGDTPTVSNSEGDLAGPARPARAARMDGAATSSAEGPNDGPANMDASAADGPPDMADEPTAPLSEMGEDPPESGTAADAAAREAGAMAKSPPTHYVYVGTGDWGAEAGRIAVYRLEQDGGLSFIQRVEAGGIAAFMAVDVSRGRLYVADEGSALLRRFLVDVTTGRLTAAGQVPVPGGPVYAALDAQANTLLTAYYSEGLVRTFPLDDSGIAATPSDTEMTGDRTHSIIVSGDNAHAYVCSVGAEKISQFTFDAAAHMLAPLSVASVSHPGGPRHLALSEDERFLYAVAETGDNVIAYTRSERGALQPLQTIARLPVGASGTGADIQLGPNGHLYVSNRAPSNTVAVFAVDASEGYLSLIEHEATGGEDPRNLAIDSEGRFLLVANRSSQTVAVFSTSTSTGELTRERVVPVEGNPFFVGVFAFEK